MNVRRAVSRVSRDWQTRDPLVPRWIERYGGTARLWWAIRFSVAACLVLVGLPILAADGGQLESLFVVTPRQMVLVSAAAMWAAIAVVATVQLGLAARPETSERRLTHGLWLAALVLLPLPLVGRTAAASAPDGDFTALTAYAGMALLGVSMAVVIALGTSKAAQRLFPRLEEWCARLKARRDRDALSRPGQTALAWLQWLARHASTQDILRAFLMLFLIVYLVGGLVLEPPRTTAIPPIIYLLVAFTVVAAALAFLASVGDRWRLPLPTILLVVAVWWSLMAPPPSHVFFVKPRAAAIEVLDPHQAAERLDIRTPVVVAASGGGIRAAAWVATVLRELQRDCSSFMRSVQFVSAVSGGSVGTLFVLDTLAPDRNASIGDLDRAVARVMQPSLSDIAWAVSYPNVTRRWFGRAAPHHDRAWALEESWRRDWRWRSTTLDDWRSALARAAMPAVAFNAVTVRPVAPLLLGNFRLPDGADAHRLQRAIEERDLDLVTAARLSATYPFVTPISHGVGPGVPGDRVADGGYIDNSGLLSAALWVTDVLPVLRDEVTELLVVEITSSDRAEQASTHAARTNGGLEQILGPLETLTEAQAVGEAMRNEVLRWAIEEQGRDRGIRVRLVTFELTGIPASWELTPRHRAQIQRRTHTDEFRKAVQQVGGSVCAPPTVTE